MADVDDFRRINESLTQTTGDAILREITDVVSRHLRDEDALARYGGDELALVLPDRTPEEALELSRRICRAVAAHPRWAEMRLALSVTISLGCATTAGPEADAATLTRRADDALYRAKRAGKNAVAGG